MPRPDSANTFLPSTSRAGPHAQLAQDAAVEVEQHVGVRGIDRPRSGRSARSAGSSCRGRRPPPAAWQLPLFSQAGQKWLPSTNSICTSMRRSPLSSGVSLCDGHARRRRCGAGSHVAAVDLHRAELAAAVRLEFRVVAQVRDIAPRRQRRLDDRLAGPVGNVGAVQRERLCLVHRTAPSVASGAGGRRRRRGRSSARAAASAPSRSNAGLERQRRAAGARRLGRNFFSVSNSGLHAVWPSPQWLVACSSRARSTISVEIVLRAVAGVRACPCSS